ncbi:MAG TPA: hypothetical protein VGM24_00995 [Puia sp.]|jgi:hypothetical protein
MKSSIETGAELNEAIAALEKKAVFQKEELKEHFAGVMENMKPLNLIKNGLQSTFSGENKQDLLKTAIGIGSGMLGRKLLIGRAGGSILRKIFGAALEFGVVGLVAKNAEKIKLKGSEFIENLFHKKKSSRSVLLPDPDQPGSNYSRKN